MRDAAGDSGEFYTPRAVVRLMVAATDRSFARLPTPALSSFEEERQDYSVGC